MEPDESQDLSGEARVSGVELDRLESAMLASYRSALPTRLADPDRLSDLYGSRFWSQPQVDKMREFCQLACRIIGAPISQVTLITEDEQHVVAAVGKSEVIESLDWSFCQYVVGMERELTIEDARRHALVCNNLTTLHGDIRSYLGVPILSRNNHVLGSFCVADTKPREWRSFDVTWMAQIAAALVTFHEAGDGES